MSPLIPSPVAGRVASVLAVLLSACYPSEADRSTISCPPQPTSGPGVSRIDLKADVMHVASGSGAIWAARRRHEIYEGPSDLVEVDPQSGETVGRPVRLESLAEDLEIGQGAVWVARRRGILVRVDPNSHRVVAQIRVGRAPRSVAVGESGVWVANGDDNTVSRIDPSTNRVIATIPVGDHPDLVVEAAGSVWVRAAYGGGSFQRIDPSTNRVTATGEMELQAVGPDAVWVIGPGAPNGILRRLDPTTLRLPNSRTPSTLPRASTAAAARVLL
jgi:YVTN family beta-propeller protein